MKKWLIVAIIATGLWACKSKKGGTGDRDAMELNDFLELFPERKMPYSVSDSSIRKSNKDTLSIKYKDFIRFIPDTLITKDFKKSTPLFYPLGKLENETESGKETYLFSKAAKDNKRVIYLTVFVDDKYSTGKAMLSTTTDAGSSQTTGLEKGFTISSMLLYRTRQGQTIYKKEAYIFNKESAAFTLILMESNDESLSRLTEVLNPLDTFPKKNKYSGDYMQDKMNIVSFRDGKNEKEYNFFVHFEKEKGECTGELKGSATFVSPELAVYNESGNPCTLHFIFNDNTVSLKEDKGCGTYRGIKCFFEGSFTKKKEAKPKEQKRKEKKRTKRNKRD